LGGTAACGADPDPDVKQLSARAEVPDLTGGDADEARDNETVDQLGWQIRVISRVTPSVSPGRVIAQSPKEGRVLKASRSITLVVAKQPPPKPKQWST
jgi:beta-lactam-binding protein with PASTA domain